MKHFEGWGSPDHSLTYYAVRAGVRAVVWSAAAVVLLAAFIGVVWIAWAVTR